MKLRVPPYTALRCAMSRDGGDGRRRRRRRPIASTPGRRHRRRGDVGNVDVGPSHRGRGRPAARRHRRGAGADLLPRVPGAPRVRAGPSHRHARRAAGDREPAYGGIKPGDALPSEVDPRRERLPHDKPLGDIDAGETTSTPGRRGERRRRPIASRARPSSLWRPTKCAWMFGRRPGAPCSGTANTSVPWKESLQGTTRLYPSPGKLSRVITTRSH